jgi:chromosomal replication initiator protein
MTSQTITITINAADFKRRGNQYARLRSIDPAAIDKLKSLVAKHTHVTVTALEGRGKPAHLALARQIAMALAYELPGASLPHVGEFFGDRDHGTVLHAIRVIQNRCQVYPDIRALVNTIRSELHNTITH